MVETRRSRKDEKTRPKSSVRMNTTTQTPTMPTAAVTSTTANTATATTSSSSSTNPLMSTLIQHKLLHKNTSVFKFAGNVGSVPADVEAYIESVDNHVSSLNLTTDDEILTEAKLFLDYSKGDLKVNCQSAEFRKLKKWTELKAYLRAIYGQVDRKDPPVSLSKIFRDLERVKVTIGHTWPAFSLRQMSS